MFTNGASNIILNANEVHSACQIMHLELLNLFTTTVMTIIIVRDCVLENHALGQELGFP